MIAFSAVLRALTKKRGMTCKDLSTATGLPNTTVWEWFTLGVRPHVDDQILKLSEFFCVSMDYLLTGKDARGKQDLAVKRELLEMRRENIQLQIKNAELENQLSMFDVPSFELKTDRQKLEYELMAVELELEAIEKMQEAA